MTRWKQGSVAAVLLMMGAMAPLYSSDMASPREEVVEFKNGEAGRTIKWYRYRPETTSGEHEYRFQARVSAFTPGGGGTGDRQEFSFTIESTGPITTAPQ